MEEKAQEGNKETGGNKIQKEQVKEGTIKREDEYRRDNRGNRRWNRVNRMTKRIKRLSNRRYRLGNRGREQLNKQNRWEKRGRDGGRG